jgi:hypothetical protein
VASASILLLGASLWLPAQQPTKTTKPSLDQTKRSSAGTFRGRFQAGFVPGKAGPESLKLVFENLADCRTYDVLAAAGATIDYSTGDFYVVVGKVIGNRIVVRSSKIVDEAANDLTKTQSKETARAIAQLSALAGKCGWK